MKLTWIFVSLYATSSHAFVNPKPTAAFVSRRADSSTMMQMLFNPFNDAKKMLVKSLAGDYDKAAVRAKLDNLIEDNTIVMLSFTK